MQPRIPNVRGWLKKWQLLPHLKWPPPQFEKCLKGQSDICCGVLLTSSWLPSQCFATMSHHVSCPAVTISLHQILICLAGQTARCVWHSSFIDGLFINCSRGVVSFSGLTLANPKESSSYRGPTHTESAGSFTVDSEWLWHAKNNLQWFFVCPALFILLAFCSYTSLWAHTRWREGGIIKTKYMFSQITSHNQLQLFKHDWLSD